MLSNDISERQPKPGQSEHNGWSGIKTFIRKQLRTFPTAENYILNVWHPIKYFYWKARWGIESAVGSQRSAVERGIDVNKTCWVDPHKIVYCSMNEFRFREYKGHILGGDWDRLEKRFDSLALYQAIDQVCVEGKPWTETSFFQQTLGDINRGRFHYSCHNQAELVQHCRNIELLFKDIKNHGYKSQKELFLSGQIHDPLVAEEEISVCVGRNGDLLFSDGAHRLAIAKILQLTSVPVKITIRHKEWIKFRDELLMYARDSRSTKELKLYQPVTHVDLCDLPASHESADRFHLISTNSDIHHGRLLDLGANLGYFCHCFEDLGLDCVAVENDPHTVYFLRRLARAENRRFAIIADSILDSARVRDIHFEVVLALNIFHHFLKTRDTFQKLTELIEHLQMDELFFESHVVGEEQMKDAYKNYSPEEFVNYIFEHTSLDSYKLIGNMDDGRPMYKLYRS